MRQDKNLIVVIPASIKINTGPTEKLLLLLHRLASNTTYPSLNYCE